MSEIDNTFDDPTRRAPLITGDHDLTTITDTICGVIENKPPKIWYIALAISFGIMSTLAISR